MKYLITIALLIFSLVSTPAFGRLGEDEGKARNRYGKPVKVEQVQDYDKRIYYNDKPYKMSILFKDGKAVIINYQMEFEGSISMWRIEHILHNNATGESGRRSSWYFYNTGNPEQVDFINRKLNATATYYLKDNTLTVRKTNK